MARAILEKATDDARAEDSPAADARRCEIADETTRALNARRKDAPSPKDEINTFNAHAEETAPNDLPDLAAQREATRERGDAYVVDTDLEEGVARNTRAELVTLRRRKAPFSILLLDRVPRRDISRQ